MAYRETSKRRKIRSMQGVAAKERIRLENAEEEIIIRRKLTGEYAKFECTRGSRIDNYRVYCNDQFQGIQSTSALTDNIRKALPAFKRMD